MINIFGFNFHLYGLILGVAILLAFEISSRAASKRKISKELVDRVFYWTVGLGILGARLYHVIDFWSRYYSVDPKKIFYFWEGGLAIWGAIIGGLCGIWISLRLSKEKVNYLELTDIGVLGLPLAQAFGRLGNWINGELYGRNGEPLFAYEGLLNVILFGCLWKMGNTKFRRGVLTGTYLIGYGIIRSSLENIREEGAIWKIGSVPTAMIFSGVAILSGVFLIWRRRS